MVDEKEKLCALLQGPLQLGQYNPQILQPILKHLDRYPWKLALLWNSNQYNDRIMVLSSNEFPNCHNYVKHRLSENHDNLNENLQRLSRQVKDKDFNEAFQTSKELKVNDFTACISNASTQEDIVQELIYMNEGQVFVLLSSKYESKTSSGYKLWYSGKRFSEIKGQLLLEIVEAGKRYSIF
ncbi:MAG: hypothetical protein HWD61_06925 [Parachlamydiaceae bacterium]|nr:MAG: hypothetical protein HWD61_06925 [Parachlamydiaceae bacterium]